MCSGIELMSSSERFEILPAWSLRFSLAAEASDAADEVELKRADIGPGKEEVAFHARPPASGVLLNLPYPPEGRIANEDICKSPVNIHAQSPEFAGRKFIQSIGGDQPNDWSVGRQSIAAGRWPELRHARSNQILPALCVQQDPDRCFGVRTTGAEKDRFQILFRRHFSVFCRAGGEVQVRAPVRSRDALSTVNNRIVVVIPGLYHDFSYLQCSAAMIRDGI